MTMQIQTVVPGGSDRVLPLLTMVTTVTMTTKKRSRVPKREVQSILKSTSLQAPRTPVHLFGGWQQAHPLVGLPVQSCALKVPAPCDEARRGRRGTAEHGAGAVSGTYPKVQLRSPMRGLSAHEPAQGPGTPRYVLVHCTKYSCLELGSRAVCS